MTTSISWAIESTLIDIYNLLVHRIEGLGWSLKDFYETDTWVVSKLYLTELDLIDKEPKPDSRDKPDPTEQNSPEMNELVYEMFGDDI